MFQRIAIANRGEIALRIVRTCRELGIQVAVLHSDADKDSLAVRFANEAINLGDPWCYLDGERIVAAAKSWGAEAIHPGYGFLAENPDFARLCAKAGLVFIGPQPDVMEHLGQKDKARQTASALGIACLPGTQTAITDVDAAVTAAEKTGYPVLIKAVAGGGGRGMRLARDEKELRELLPRAMSEAKAAFKSPAVYIEQYLRGARHVEVQVLADTSGNVVHLGERDCTVQRRHQKLIEEAPSPAVDATIRAAMTEAATKLLAHVGYVNAGTVEFLVDDEGHFYFLEVNTRIQVEHPVTEMLYGVDLIAEQIRIAAGLPLSVRQDELQPSGWVIECRINAEDVAKDFMPAPGRITSYSPPGGPGVRVDASGFAGWMIPPHYDSMIAKLIVHAPDRQTAIARMLRALDEFHIEGVPTTAGFHKAVLNHADFVTGRFDTTFVEKAMKAGELAVERSKPSFSLPVPGKAADKGATAVIAAAVAAITDRPHRIISIASGDDVGYSTLRSGGAPNSFWGTAGRFDLMQRRYDALQPRRDRRI